MNSELRNLTHPLRIRLYWVALYSLILVAIVLGTYFVAAKVKTHVLPVGQVQLTVPYSKYLVGETISFSIKNGYNSPIYVLNNCPSEPLAVYRQINGAWVRQHDEASLADCPTEERQVDVAANAVVNGNFAPWHHLFSQPGKYRVVAFVESYNALPYQDFEIVAKPVIKALPAAPANTSSSAESLPTSSPSPEAQTSQTIVLPSRSNNNDD